MSLLPIQRLIAQATHSRGANSIDFRERIIASKDSGYVILYPHEPADDAVYTPAFEHKNRGSHPNGYKSIESDPNAIKLSPNQLIYNA